MTFANFLHLFNRTANRLNVKPQIEASHVCEIARRILKQDYPAMWTDCTVKSYQKGTLTLGALNSNAAQELFFLRTKLLRQVNEKFKRKIITQIKIHHDLHKKEDNYYS